MVSGMEMVVLKKDVAPPLRMEYPQSMKKQVEVSCRSCEAKVKKLRIKVDRQIMVALSGDMKNKTGATNVPQVGPV